MTLVTLSLWPVGWSKQLPSSNRCWSLWQKLFHIRCAGGVSSLISFMFFLSLLLLITAWTRRLSILIIAKFTSYRRYLIMFVWPLLLWKCSKYNRSVWNTFLEPPGTVKTKVVVSLCIETFAVHRSYINLKDEYSDPQVTIHVILALKWEELNLDKCTNFWCCFLSIVIWVNKVKLINRTLTLTVIRTALNVCVTFP